MTTVDPVQDFVTTPMVPSQNVAQSYADEKKSLDKGDADVYVSSPVVDDRDPELIPTPEEMKTLRRVPAGMPVVAILMCLIEFSERASYYGSSGPFNNFINNPLPEGGPGTGAVAPGAAGMEQSAGALDKGSAITTALTKTFTFLAYVIPIAGGIIADNYWGRFKTICVGTFVGFIAHVILVVPAIPSVIKKPDASLGTFIISILILAFAAGFIKPSLGPLLCDQSPVKEATIATTKKGERVIIDPEETVKRYLLIFYGCINIGALFQIATQYSARLVGFWLAYLLPGILYMLMPLVLVFAAPRLVKLPPQGSVLPDVWRVFKCCCSNGGWKRIGRGGDDWWNAAKPSVRAANGHGEVIYDDLFVDEVRQTLNACAVFLLIPIFVLANGGLGNSQNDMSNAMTKGGVPNDLIGNFNSIAIIVFTPIVTFGFYPLCSKLGWPVRPMARMTIGFLLASVGCICAAIIQWRIYKTSPCGHYASHCKVGTTVSPISLWWQIPQIFFPALGELFVNVTSYELAYTRSPPRMKNFVYAIALFNSAIGAAITMALAAVVVDPNLHIPWIVLACLTFILAWVFPTYFKELNNFDFEWSAEERAAAKAQTVGPRDEEKY